MVVLAVCLNTRDVDVLEVLPLDFRFTLVLGELVGDVAEFSTN
jgi:hypothetical protein